MLQKKEASQEDIDDKRQEIENLRQKMNDLLSETTQHYYIGGIPWTEHERFSKCSKTD